MSDTSLVFNLVARERVSETLGKVKEKFNAAATGIAAGVAGALGVGVAQAMDMSAANAKLAAQLGVGPAEAVKLAKVSANVYAGAWGDSAETVNEAIRGVYQNIGDVSQAKGGIEGITSKALALSETFDQEVGPATAAVGQILKTGLAKNADEAFDILTAGFQSGADKAGDLLDTFNEYGTQFRSLGLDGQTAMGLISQGLKGGARDADLVADSLKEFNLRARDITSTAPAGFQALGLNAKQMAADVAAGGPRATKALQMTLDALRKYPDTSKKASLAAAIFGTQSEDMQAALESLDPSTAVSAMGQVGGAADKAMKTLSESPAKTLERFKRTVTTKLADVAGTFIKFATDNQGVMEPLAYTLGGVAAAVLVIKAGMVVWTAAQTAWSAATTIATGAQWLWNAALAASPVTWIIVGIVALIAAIVLIATKTTWFQTIWSVVWGAIKTAFNATISWLAGAFAWFGSLPGKFAGWFGQAKDWAIKKMIALIDWQRSLPGRLLTALANLAGSLRNRASSAFQSMKDAAISKATSTVNWVRGLPGRITGAIGKLNNLLYNKGRDFIRGLGNGITSLNGWLWNLVTGFVKRNVVDAAKSFLHIGSPSKLAADEIGQWIPAGVAMGVEDNAAVVDRAMRGLVKPELARPAAAPLTTGMAPVMGAAAGGGAARVIFEFTGADGDFKKFVRKIVRVDGRGNVQVAFGQGQ
ncbi:phage tail tape measure protein [Streptomyces sp. NPDC046984]|uniref:phage tail tape measure protein n=1 Tax=Streptomyces sp. NPDC046984 TaxID=3155138 RepID=UPI003405453F